jgi:hypothetical protein
LVEAIYSADTNTGSGDWIFGLRPMGSTTKVAVTHIKPARRNALV